MLSRGQQRLAEEGTQELPQTTWPVGQVRVQVLPVQATPVGQSALVQHASWGMQLVPQALKPLAQMSGLPQVCGVVVVMQVCSPSPLASRQSALLQHEPDAMQVPLQSVKPVVQAVGPPQVPPVQVAPVPCGSEMQAVPFGAAGFEHVPIEALQTPATWH